MNTRRKLALALTLGTLLLQCMFIPEIALGQEAAVAPAVTPVTTTQPQDHVVTGTQVLNASDLAAISNLTVQNGSTLILDFGSGGGNGTVPGTISNGGTIYAVSSVANVTAATINANQFNNQTSAIFTSVLPQGGLSGFANLVTNFGLNFNVNSFVNSGLIESAGNLNVTAVNNFVNAGTMTSAGNITALASSAAIVNSGVMQAVQNINLTSGIGSIINSGTITAAMGNININSLIQNNILNNVSGLLQASNGSINIGSAQSALQNISINDGDFIAKEINLIAPGGEINAMLGTVNGTLSTIADMVHLGSSTGNLTLGEITCTGDPTYFNDAGDITITGNISVGEALAIIASNNIIIDPNVSITAQDINGQGFPIYLVAGALVTSASVPILTIPGAPPVLGNAVSDVTINGNSTAGGNIIFSGNNTISSNSIGPCIGCAGADTTLVAYTGTVGLGNGRIDMVDASNSIDASGVSGGDNGNINLIAGGAQGGGSLASITAGTLTSNGGNASTGTINLYALPPTSTDPNPIVFGTDGSINSANAFSFFLTLATDSNIITTGAITAPNVNALAVASFVANANISGETIALTVFSPTPSTFTNNASIIATDGTLYISSANIENNGLLASTSLLNAASVQFQTDGDLTITQGLGASIQANGPPLAGDIAFSTAGANAISVNGGSIISDFLDITGAPGYGVNLTANAISSDININGNPYAGVQISAATGNLSICGSCLDTSNSGGGNGGNVTISAPTGGITMQGDIITDGFGAGNRAGNVFIQAGQGYQQFGGISAQGVDDASGGNVTILTPQGTAEIENFSGPAVRTSADGLAGNGGNVTVVANTLALAGDFTSIDTTSFSGLAGNVTLTQLSSAPFVIGACGCTNIGGDIVAIGLLSGGKVALQSGGSFEIQPPITIAAFGLFQAGSIAFSSTAPTLNVHNDGFLVAATPSPDSNSGVVGFQSFGNPINLTGSGFIAAGQFVAFGNLDPVTLTPFNATILDPTTAFTYGNISAMQGVPMLLRIAVSNPPTPIPVPVPAPVIPVTPTLSASIPTLGIQPGLYNPIILQTDQQSQLIGLAGKDELLALQGFIRQSADSPVSNGRLIIATEDGVVNTQFGDLFIKNGAVVYLMETADGATIYNLHDDHEGSVNFVAAGKSMNIPIGAFVMSTNSDAGFDNLNPAKSLAIRGLTQSPLGDGKIMHAGEFSLASALTNIEPLAELRHSDAPNERKIIAHIMQDAAILMTITAKNGVYTASSE